MDPDRIPQFDLVAEDVAKVNPDLVVRDPEGKVFTSLISMSIGLPSGQSRDHRSRLQH